VFLSLQIRAPALAGNGKRFVEEGTERSSSSAARRWDHLVDPLGADMLARTNQDSASRENCPKSAWAPSEWGRES